MVWGVEDNGETITLLLIPDEELKVARDIWKKVVGGELPYAPYPLHAEIIGDTIVVLRKEE